MDNAGSSKEMKRPLSSASFLEGLPPLKEFEKLIECPVCQDILLPPVFQCQTGHSLCSKCKDKVKECPTCKAPYVETRNFLMESIAQTSSFYCSHRDKGCNVTGSSDVMKDHLKNCTFRPARCYLVGSDGCQGGLVFLSDYVAHLIGTHESGRMISVEGKQNVFTCSYNIENYDGNDWNEKSRSWWGPDLISFDEKEFVTRVFRRGTKFFFQLAVIAEPTDNAKYTVKITISNDKFQKYAVTSLVPSIREFRDNNGQFVEGEFGAVSKDEMDKLGHRDEMEMNWDIRYKLTKIVNPAVNKIGKEF